MDEALAEPTQTKAAAREKVITHLNSITLSPLPFFLDSPNLQVTKLTASLSDGVVADVNRDTSSLGMPARL